MYVGTLVLWLKNFEHLPDVRQERNAKPEALLAAKPAAIILRLPYNTHYALRNHTVLVPCSIHRSPFFFFRRFRKANTIVVIVNYGLLFFCMGSEIFLNNLRLFSTSIYMFFFHVYGLFPIYMVGTNDPRLTRIIRFFRGKTSFCVTGSIDSFFDSCSCCQLSDYQ